MWKGASIANVSCLQNLFSGSDLPCDRGAIMFSCGHHLVAPCHGFARWHVLYDTEGLITQEVFEQSLLPV